MDSKPVHIRILLFLDTSNKIIIKMDLVRDVHARLNSYYDP